MTKKKSDLNKREKAILKFIEKQVIEDGYPPSVREIGKAVGLSSTATVHGYLAKLKEKGYIKKEDKKGRTLKLLKGSTGESIQKVEKDYYSQKRVNRCTISWKNYSWSTYFSCRKCIRHISYSDRFCW